MSDEDKAPKLGDWVWQRVFQRFGIQGLVGLALVAAMFFVWTQWDAVKTWPDISSLFAYFSREAVPPANSHQFYVAVADLEDDNANGDHKRLIVSLLQDFEGIQVLSFDRTITVKEPVPGEQERTGHQRAREYLQESNASILIWGSVLRHGKQTKPELYLTVAGGKLDKSKQYTLEIGTEFRLPKLFWGDLSDVLRLVITMQDTRIWAKEGHYVADRLQPFIERVRSLLKESANRPGWNVDAIGSTRVILADALQTLGDQSRQNKPIAEAVAAYREALKGWTRDRLPLDWAMTQNNLGNALSRLGERESGTKWLEEAVAAYREALKEWTRDRLPLDWAMTQNNLGNALSRLGERESGTKRLEEAVLTYREALKEGTRNSVPQDWATTQNNLRVALWSLGERESGTKWLEEAVAAYREALKEWTRDRLPLDWAMTQNNLGVALWRLGERENSTKRLKEAVAAYREALKELTHDRVLLAWAMTQNNLGTALLSLGERESGTKRLEEAVAAYREALNIFEAAEATYYASVTKNNLGRAQALLVGR